MGGKFDDAVSPADIMHRMREIERNANAQATARNLESASIGRGGLRVFGGGDITLTGGGNIDVNDGGSITIRGGDFRMTSIDDTTGLVFFGGPTRLWALSFANGEIAFNLTPQGDVWTLRDNASNFIVANDAESGVGLARPYLNIPMVPSSGTSIGTGGPFWPEFVNATFQEVMHCITTLWHPRIAVGVNSSTASGTVEWELRVDGVTAGSGTGDTSGEFDVPGWGGTTNPGDQRSVQLWARNTAGTATRLIVDMCYGTQS